MKEGVVGSQAVVRSMTAAISTFKPQLQLWIGDIPYSVRDHSFPACSPPPL